MCIDKLRALFNKCNKSQNNDVKLQELRDADFKQKVNELSFSIISIEGDKYLKANELLNFMGGGDIEQIIHNKLLLRQIESALVRYVVKCDKTSMLVTSPRRIQVSTDDNNNQTRYAFNEKVISFLEQEYKNDKNMPYLVNVVRYVYENINELYKF